jgi:WD40 repeat protein
MRVSCVPCFPHHNNEGAVTEDDDGVGDPGDDTRTVSERDGRCLAVFKDSEPNVIGGQLGHFLLRRSSARYRWGRHHVLDLGRRDRPGSRRLAGHGANVNLVALSAAGQRALTASDDGTARLRDAGDSRELAGLQLAGHDGPVRGAAFSTDGKMIVTFGHDRTA